MLGYFLGVQSGFRKIWRQMPLRLHRFRSISKVIGQRLYFCATPFAPKVEAMRRPTRAQLGTPRPG